jgi:glycosyltransferase involved in cell wall biosynthesis
MPLCTVAIPVFNRPSLIRHAIDSAMAQDVDGLEVLVVDNCSTDNTWDVLQEYRDERLRLVRNSENLGLVGNMNRCLELASGRYLRFLCSDDRLVTGTLQSELDLMERHPEVVLLSGRNQLVDEEDRVQGTLGGHLGSGIYKGGEAGYALLWYQAHYGYNPFNYPSGVLLRRDAAIKAGGFDKNLGVMLDLDYFLRVLRFGDLAIWDGMSAEILVHSNQEATVLGDAVQMTDLFQITESYRDLLLEKGAYSRLRRQFAGISFGLAIRHMIRGRTAAGRSHFKLLKRQGVSWPGMTSGLLLVLSLRLLRMVTSEPILPDAFRRSVRPL